MSSLHPSTQHQRVCFVILLSDLTVQSSLARAGCVSYCAHDDILTADTIIQFAKSIDIKNPARTEPSPPTGSARCNSFIELAVTDSTQEFDALLTGES